MINLKEMFLKLNMIRIISKEYLQHLNYHRIINKYYLQVKTILLVITSNSSFKITYYQKEYMMQIFNSLMTSNYQIIIKRKFQKKRMVKTLDLHKKVKNHKLNPNLIIKIKKNIIYLMRPYPFPIIIKMIDMESYYQ